MGGSPKKLHKFSTLPDLPQFSFFLKWFSFVKCTITELFFFKAVSIAVDIPKSLGQRHCNYKTCFGVLEWFCYCYCFYCLAGFSGCWWSCLYLLLLCHCRCHCYCYWLLVAIVIVIGCWWCWAPSTCFVIVRQLRPTVMHHLKPNFSSVFISN